VIASSPAVANGVVYIGSDDGKVYALNATTGSKLWSYTTSGGTGANAVVSSPAVANGIVYLGSEDGQAYALNGSTGAKLWNTTVGPTDSSPAVLNGSVFIGSDENIISAFGLP
jgi:outer membrane protein assembly factor BamB